MYKLANNMALLRKSKELSQTQIGKIIGKSTAMISFYEKGLRKPDQISITRFLEYFSITEEDLFFKDISVMDAMIIARNAPLYETYINTNKVHTEEDGISSHEIPIIDSLEIPYKMADRYSELNSGSNFVGSKINELLNKHQINRTIYAKERLGVSIRTLQRIIAGDVNPDFRTIAIIAQDLGESLDYFRMGPLPKGHLLLENKLLSDRVEEQASTLKSILKKRNANQKK